MKSYFFLLILGGLAMAICACDDVLDYSLSSSAYPRSEHQRHPPRTGKDSSVVAASDTSFYFSAVNFSASYDWQRDSSYGLESFELILYKDMKPVVTIPSYNSICVSANPDSHHIIAGALYTEICISGQTIIARNGEELFNWRGQEVLKGLYVSGAIVYTLGEDKITGHTILRKNGEMVSDIGQATVFGDLSEPSYAPTGALYADRGKICFCYMSKREGILRYYKNIAGEEQLITDAPSGVEDIRLVGGGPNYALTRHGNYFVEDGRIWNFQGASLVSGKFSQAAGSSQYSASYYFYGPKQYLKLGSRTGTIYHGAKVGYVLSTQSPYNTILEGSEMKTEKVFKDYRPMGPACAVVSGDEILIGLSPASHSKPCIIIHGSESYEVDGLHGYISCLYSGI